MRASRGWIRAASVVALIGAAAGASVPLLRAATVSDNEPQRASPFSGRSMYVNPNSDARHQADAWQGSRRADAELIRHIADQPQAIWFGDWNRDPRSDVDRLLGGAGGSLVVLAVYNIPYRDCGLYSRGGAGNADNYRRWILELARGIRGRPVAIVLEPDAVAAADCLPARLRDERYVLVREATDVLKKAGALVYIDAGNAYWKSASEMGTRLNSAGIQLADGFALNVSNFQATSALVSYGDQVSRLVGGKHYVIDTSRNGRGNASSRAWCNPGGQALGQTPTGNTGRPLVDAFLWVKVPGQSDGTCNGGPNAGKWWPEYALGLARSAQGQ